MIRKTLLLLLLFVAAYNPCAIARTPDQTYTGRAVKIIDGDTFDLLTDNNRTIRIRLHGIDCPERGQAFYKVCKTALGDRCLGQRLKVVVRDIDQYKRKVADVYADNDIWINERMVAGGYAWHFTRYDRDQRLDLAERKAREAKSGLWRDAAPVAPWEWRKARRGARTF